LSRNYPEQVHIFARAISKLKGKKRRRSGGCDVGEPDPQNHA
jgi:hypothetical protein